MHSVTPLEKAQNPQVFLFGPFRIKTEERITSSFRSGRVPAILAYLLLHPTGEVSREELADRLWPRLDADAARNNLRVNLLYLRQALREHGLDDIWLSVERSRIAIDRSGLRTDLQEFEELCESARESAPSPGRIDRLKRAFRLSAPGLLPELYDEWAAARQAAVARERFAIACELAAELAGVNPSEALSFARDACAQEPLSDQARELLANLHLRLNQPEAAAIELREHAKLVRKELGLDIGARLQDLLERAERESRPIAAPARPAFLTTFHGRHEELELLEDWLMSDGRLLTLYGPGGIGKTRLASEAVARAAPNTEAYWIDLAAVKSGSALLEGVCHVIMPMSVASEDLLAQLRTTLGSRPVLLVLDNLEQLPDSELGIVADLLRSLPLAKVIATSRKTLGVGGETLLRVAPLPVPSDSEPSDSPAYRLLLDRARASRAGFDPDAKGQRDLSELTRMLEGVPLAIELAAARMTALDIGDLLQGMAKPLELLVSTRHPIERHRTIRSTLEWSFSQIEDESRRGLLALSVLHGDWTLDAARGIVAALTKPVPADLLIQTGCEHSLVAPVLTSHGSRFKMLACTREFAWEALNEEERERASSAHADYFLSLARNTASDPSLFVELANLEAALNYLCESGRLDLFFQMAEALMWIWQETSAALMGLRIMQQASRRPRPDADRARLLRFIAALHVFLADFTAAESCASEGIGIARELGEKELLGKLLAIRARVRIVAGEAAEAMADAREALELTTESAESRADTLHTIAKIQHFQKDQLALQTLEKAYQTALHAGSPRLLIQILDTTGCIQQSLGNYPEAERAFESIAKQPKGYLFGSGEPMLVFRLACLAFARGQHELARQRFEDALSRARQIQSTWLVTQSLTQLGDLAQAVGDYEGAIRRHQESLDIRSLSGDRPGLVSSHFGLGSALLEMGEHRRSFELLTKATDQAREMDAKHFLVHALIVSARAAIQLGEKEIAVRDLRESLGYAEEMIAAGVNPERMDVAQLRLQALQLLDGLH